MHPQIDILKLSQESYSLSENAEYALQHCHKLVGNKIWIIEPFVESMTAWVLSLAATSSRRLSTFQFAAETMESRFSRDENLTEKRFPGSEKVKKPPESELRWSFLWLYSFVAPFVEGHRPFYLAYVIFRVLEVSSSHLQPSICWHFRVSARGNKFIVCLVAIFGSEMMDGKVQRSVEARWSRGWLFRHPVESRNLTLQEKLIAQPASSEIVGPLVAWWVITFRRWID